MILSSPGHSEVLVELEGSTGPVRVLFDAWLSDFAFGDFLKRNPGVDLASLPQIDAVYISHGHCDHFDPYTLMALYRSQNPILVLPETIEFLLPLIHEFLPQVKAVILRHNRSAEVLGIAWTAFGFPVHYVTNEEDVMPLVLRGKSESVFFEADIALPDSAEAHAAVDRAMGNTERVFVSTRNELEALYSSYDAKSPQDRKQRLAAYRRKRRDELAFEYERYAEYDLPSPFRPRNLKLITGQGMIFPPELNPAFLPLSSPLPLSEAVEMEKTAARNAGYDLDIQVLEPGEQIDSRTRKKSRGPFQVKPHAIRSDLSAPPPAAAAQEPLFDEERDRSAQKAKILSLLNDRFLPYLAYHREEPLKQLLAGRGPYRIRIRFGTSRDFEERDFAASFKDLRFVETSAEGQPQEMYWANDLDDFLSGRQDQFSTTLHRFFEHTTIRLWTMMGLPFLNNDLVYAKMRFHFERASRGETVNDWALETGKKRLHSVRSS